MNTGDSSTPDNFDLDQLAAAEANQTQEPQKKSRREALWLAGIAGVIILLGAAAFIGVRLGLLGLKPGPGPAGGSILPGGPGSIAVQINITPAPELPQTAPEMVGVYARQDGSSIFLNEITGVEGTTSIVGASADVTGPSNSSYSPPTGAEVEVVITKDTKIYKEITDFPAISQSDQMQIQNIQQKVELVDTLDGLASKTPLRVWGEKRGDRVIAQVVLYSEMVMSTH